MQFWLTVVVVPHTAVNIQQTPKPAAQLPSAEPLLSLHSVSVMQVPIMVASDAVVQASC